MRLRDLTTTILCICLAFAATGQSEFKKAEKLLNLKAFDLAIKNYQTALAKHPNNALGHAQLGESYLMTNQLLDALKSYERAFAIEGSIDSKYKLQYATTLKKVGLYDLAESVFFEYATTNKQLADHMLASNEFAKSILQAPDQYDILNFEFNSDKSDFGISFYKDKAVFCSFRDDLKRETDKKNDSYILQPGNQIFKVAKDGTDRKVAFLRPDFKEVYNIGPLSYSKDGRMVAYMRNTFTTGSNQIFSDESNMSIYIALTNEDGDFTSEKPFPYNQIEYSYAFPNLGFNGKALYFASNRPGGAGGFDIYVSYFQDGKWLTPENLGSAINTAGDEISPFFDGEKLFFASDYHFGLGGFDNFESEVRDGSWTKAKNLGKGINSPSDDYYLTPDISKDTYYFTSNRLGGRGKDDIYIAHKMMSNTMPIASAYDEVPIAVNLDELAAAHKSDIPANKMNKSSSESSAKVVSVSSEESVAILNEEGLLDLSDARLIAVTSPSKAPFDEFAEVYFIQLASLTRSEGKMASYNGLSVYGQLYRFFKSSSVKIRLGYFASRDEAEKVLKNVKTKGFNDAFITRDVLASSNYEVLNSSSTMETDEQGWVNDYNPESSYKVKLASYLDPLKFQVDNVLDLGRLEQWTKGQWTIFILGGYETIDQAKQARIKAINRGFVDAELVEDDRGILSRVKER